MENYQNDVQLNPDVEATHSSAGEDLASALRRIVLTEGPHAAVRFFWDGKGRAYTEELVDEVATAYGREGMIELIDCFSPASPDDGHGGAK